MLEVINFQHCHGSVQSWGHMERLTVENVSGHFNLERHPHSWLLPAALHANLHPSSLPFMGLMGAATVQDDERMQQEAGVGFIDVGVGHPCTQLSSISTETFQSWIETFYSHLKEHVQQSCRSIG